MKEHEVNSSIGHRSKPLPDNGIVTSIKPRKLMILQDRIGQRLLDREQGYAREMEQKMEEDERKAKLTKMDKRDSEKNEIRKKPNLREFLGKFGTDAKIEETRLISFAKRRQMTKIEHLTAYETTKTHTFSKECNVAVTTSGARIELPTQQEIIDDRRRIQLESLEDHNKEKIGHDLLLPELPEHVQKMHREYLEHAYRGKKFSEAPRFYGQMLSVQLKDGTLSRKPDTEYTFGNETPSLELIAEEVMNRRDFCKSAIDDI